MKNSLKFIFGFAILAQCVITELPSYEDKSSSEAIILACDGCRGGK